MIKINDHIKRLKKNLGTFILGCFLALIVFNSNIKTWVLQHLLTISIFNAHIKNDPANSKILHNVNFLYMDSTKNTLAISALKGKVVFINFWASWCPPCRAEMYSLNQLYLKFEKDTRIVFLFINEDEDDSKAIKYVEANHYKFPLIFTKSNIPEELFSGSLPTTIVLNKDGKIVLKHEGLAAYNTRDFMNEIHQLEN